MLSLALVSERWANRLPVGVKFSALALATAALYATEDPYRLGGALVAISGLYLSLGRDCRIALAPLRPMRWMLLMLGLYHLLTDQLQVGSQVMLRLSCLIALANWITLTSRLDDTMAMVQTLARPLRLFGLNPKTLSLSIALVMRFTPLLQVQARQLSESWRARSLKPANWRIIMPLCIVALKDADAVAEALRARGGVIDPHNSQKYRNKNGT